MGIEIRPTGDRLLVKLARLTEKKVGNQILTLAVSDKKRIQPETAKFRVISIGEDVPPTMGEQFIIARSDAGAVLSSDIITDDEHRLYRIIEYPEILAVLGVTSDIGSASDVIPEKVVI